MSRPNPNAPAREQELEHWQQQSESKFPPGAPRQRLHELPRLAASNEAAASPTKEEELPTSLPGFEDSLIDGDGSPAEKPSRAPNKPFVKDTVLERFENEGGTIDPDKSGAGLNPSPPLRGYDIVT